MSIFTSSRSLVLVLLVAMLGACSGATHPVADPDRVAETEKGPHGGRMLRDGDLAVELAIFETGVPPEYRAWVSSKGKPVPPGQLQLTVRLTRLDGEQNTFSFQPVQDFLQGSGTVSEPHSFSVLVSARLADRTHEWRYDSFEGRVTIAAAAAQAAGIEVSRAGPATIREVLSLYGRVVLNPEAVREVSARFAGTVQSVAATPGERVRAGQVLARVESNDSLQVYSVTAPIAGTVTERRTNPGEAAGIAPLFVISDLGQAWVELSLFPQDVARVRVGQTVRIRAVEGESLGEARIARIAPAAAAGTQALRVWAKPGNGAQLVAGRFVNADVLVGGAEVPLAVRSAALQGFRDFTVVFMRIGDTYEVRMLDVGRSDGEFTEVLGGLKSGTEYVSANSYLIKADIEKSGASHDH